MAINEGLRNRSDLPIETAYEWSRTEVAWLTGLTSAVLGCLPTRPGNYVVAWYPPKLFLAATLSLCLHCMFGQRAAPRLANPMPTWVWSSRGQT